MNIIESFRLAWVGISTNKFRSFLTMLGMIIGVGSVIAMISIGEGGQNQILDQMSGLGTGTLQMYGGYGSMRLSFDDGAFLAEQAPHVTHFYPNQQLYGANMKAGLNTGSYQAIGTSPDYTFVQQWNVGSGMFITDEHISSRSSVAVIGTTIQDELFDGRNAIGELMRIDGQVFEVIGIMEKKGTSMGMSVDNQVFIPVTTALRMQGTKYVDQFTFLVSDPKYSKLAQGEIKMGLRELFGDLLDREDPFYIYSMDDMLDVMNEAIGTFTLLLAGIAGISLLVGGIGIMNIMLVSVTERTREIGIRKALGAKHRDLLVQFLIEAMLISLTGGLIGMGLGIAGSNLVASYAGWAQTISGRAVMLALSFSMAVGLFFGIYPANKAAKMDPIDALRYQ